MGQLNFFWMIIFSLTLPSFHPQYENYGTGWDSGLKVLPYEQSHRRRPQSGGGTYYDIEGVSHTRNVRPDNWGVENRKTLGWESTGTYGLPAEGYRHIAMPRHMDMMQFHKRICGVCACFISQHTCAQEWVC